jgi:diaminohydroxyphosphoribosylaminopyrimidine deaminase/5-amino-6-(5-phosphoribosylamino)uracil reductase
MQIALDLAKKGMHTSMPNPRVGCIVVRENQIIGQGWHRAPGEVHAESIALSEAGNKAQGSTVYSTLEPCTHYGKTPPCVEALIAARVGKVVYAVEDPNPIVSGQSRKILESAEIEVITGILSQESKDLNIGFHKRMKTGLPYIRTKIAASIDGKTALMNGQSKWISSIKSRDDVQLWRARSCAIVTSIDTVIADDPSLNVRMNDFLDNNQPTRVILDSQLRIKSHYKILKSPGDVIVYSLKQVHNDPIFEGMIENIEEHDGHVSLESVFRDLAKKEINEVMIECGGILNGALLKQNLIDEIIIYLAPCILGDQANNMFSLPVISVMSDRYNFNLAQVDKTGDDARIILKKLNLV